MLPAMPEMDDTHTMRPPSLSAPDATSASLMRSCVDRFTFTTICHRCSFMLAMVLSRVMPALCTITSQPPSAMAASTKACGASAEPMSSAIALPPILAATASRPSCACGTSRQITLAPSRAMTSAMDAPMPRDAPVTSTFLPASGAAQSAGAPPAPTGLPMRITCAET